MDDREQLREEVLGMLAQGFSKREIARQLGRPKSTVSDWISYYYLDLDGPSSVDQYDRNEEKEALRSILAKRKGHTVESLADDMDVAPRRVRALIEELQADGYRAEIDHGQVELQRIAPSKNNLHKILFDGDTFRVGIVSDTHLCSKEEALPELHMAYDTFVEEGITEVWHAGDLVAGVGIYATQNGDLKHHTLTDQVDYATLNYPRRDGIKTRIIAGNHDIEGSFGRLGANPVVMVCNVRDDMEYLGDYQAWLEMPNGAWGCLHHGRGGTSYAVSYKPQKIIEGLPGGRKPALMIFGHWHVAHLVRHRKVHALLGGCFEWSTSLMTRLGLAPDPGFWIVEGKLATDGTLTRVKTEFFPFYEGREVKHSRRRVVE